MLCERAPVSVRWHRRTTTRLHRKCAPARSCCPHRPRKPLRWCSTAPQTLYARYPFNPSAPGRSGGTIWAPHCPPTPHLQSPQQRKLLPHTPHPSHRNGSRAPPVAPTARNRHLLCCLSTPGWFAAALGARCEGLQASLLPGTGIPNLRKKVRPRAAPSTKRCTKHSHTMQWVILAAESAKRHQWRALESHPKGEGEATQ